MGMEYDDGRLAVVKASRGCGRNFWESPSLGRVWGDVFGGGERGQYMYLRCWDAAMNKTAGLSGPGLSGIVVQVVHCPKKAKK